MYFAKFLCKTKAKSGPKTAQYGIFQIRLYNNTPAVFLGEYNLLYLVLTYYDII
jgi:hypothetical protein